MANYTKKPEEIEIIREGGKILGGILQRTAALVKPGISTAELNDFAEREIIIAGGRPSFMGYGDRKNPFPAGLCTSINDAVVHGVPSAEDILQEGDIIGLDIGMEYKDLFTDTAITVPVGKVSKRAELIIKTTKLALVEAIRLAKAGNRIGDMGFAMQSIAEKAGFSVVRDLVGHGVGYAVHEDPAVPCYGKAGTGLELVEGMVLAIEPMICEKKPRVVYDSDGWTIRTSDGGLAAHFEHTIAITKKSARILTAPNN
ncbi:MAG TPA: type I methionyl aminopeptidase [Candidatus Doudnabacteria bacterium]|nr:type I methionyl aminopeptidase [Candidatus Doudnabacteria bacterium]